MITTLLALALVATGCDPALSANPPELEMHESDTWLPGATPPPPEVLATVAAALSTRPEGYVPRTRHLLEDGSPRYTNRLILESSPYLRQHAHNPVDWHPWGDEAFAEAAATGKPVLLSVGYSTCHWCHVMEEESFEDPVIAVLLNRLYVPIKVDREERPDVDAVYMAAVMALTGRGGWPMTVWLDAERKPFYGGTYYPARDGDRGVSHGFETLLLALEEVYRERPDDVRGTATQVMARVHAELGGPSPSASLPDASTLTRASSSARAGYDPIHGGMQGAPKFPSSLPVRLLLRDHRRSGDRDLLHIATHSLDAMATGGIYDHVGGGFHRYATDSEWLVPHFEKMLYDNALLVPAYLEAWAATGEARHADVARDVLDYVAREMTAPGGGFYAATDADSLTPSGEREEGWYFTWTPAELEQVLGADRARVVASHFAVKPGGNFEGRSILHTPRSLDRTAESLGMTRPEVESALASSRLDLREARSLRPPPLRDDKIIAGWNGLMISAFARAALALDEPSYARSAAAAADFALTHLQRDGRLVRTWTDGQLGADAFMEDHAFLAAATLDLYEATGELRWLQATLDLDLDIRARFEDHEGGGWYFTSADAESLLVREKPSRDGAIPSGASIHTLTLHRLEALTGDDSYRQRADAALRAYAPVLQRHPLSMSELLLSLNWRRDRAVEIVIVVPDSRDEARPLLDVLRHTWTPNSVLAVVCEGEDLDALAALAPVVSGKVARDGAATAYVCEKGACQQPTTDPESFKGQLRGS